MPLEDDEAPVAAPPPKPRSKLPLILVSVLLAAGIGVGGWYFGHLGAPAPDTPKPLPPPVYHRLEPAFVVNVSDRDTLRYLQAEVQVMARDAAVFEKLEAQGPAVRDALLTLFAGYPYSELISVEGRERLRVDTLTRLREALDDEAAAAQIEAIYFTSFVMQ
jgi:flagellar protein FliL